MIPYSKEEIVNQIEKNCAEWSFDGQDIYREYTFPNFIACIHFVNSVAIISETLNHHPDIFISWGKVQIKVHTHSISGIGQLDFKLAIELDKYYILHKE